MAMIPGSNSTITDDDILKAMYAGDARLIVELFARRIGKWPLSEEEMQRSIEVIRGTIQLPLKRESD